MFYEADKALEEPFEFCEICHSPIEVVETERGVTLRCDCP